MFRSIIVNAVLGMRGLHIYVRVVVGREPPDPLVTQPTSTHVTTCPGRDLKAFGTELVLCLFDQQVQDMRLDLRHLRTEGGPKDRHNEWGLLPAKKPHRWGLQGAGRLAMSEKQRVPRAHAST